MQREQKKTRRQQHEAHILLFFSSFPSVDSIKTHPFKCELLNCLTRNEIIQGNLSRSEKKNKAKREIETRRKKNTRQRITHMRMNKLMCLHKICFA